MTSEQVKLVQTSFAAVLGIRQQAAQIFYERLFELEPEVRKLFRGDLGTQGAKLMTMIGVVVRALDDLEPLLGTIDELARRHRGYGVVERHYHVVGAALIQTLEQGLGDAFTDDVRQAWLAAYGLLSTRMIAAARETPRMVA